MKRLLMIISWLALAATLLPSCFFLAGTLPLESLKTVMLVSTLVWFAVTPIWMKKEEEAA